MPTSILEDAVAMPIVQGHERHGPYDQGRGGNPERLLVSLVDDGTSSLAWAQTRVRIVPTDRR